MGKDGETAKMQFRTEPSSISGTAWITLEKGLLMISMSGNRGIIYGYFGSLRSNGLFVRLTLDGRWAH